MSDLKGRIILVTGAAGTLGSAVCKAIAESGGTAIGTDLVQKPGLDYQHDVTSEADWARIVTDIEARFGRLDGLVNNAGIILNGTVEDTELSDFQRVMTVNVDSCFLGSKVCWPLLRKSDGASIVNVSSAAGMVGSAGHVAYCASKGAVRLMSKSIALHGAKMEPPIRCNSLHPSLMPGQMARTIFGESTDTEDRIVNVTRQRNPMGRLADPAEVARGVVFLLSKDSSFTTGSELLVEGGATAV